MKRYRARWVVPVTRPPIENGCVVENNGVIEYVGPIEGAPPGEDHDLGESVLLPGIINTHTHLELTAMRGFLEDLCFNDWIDKLRSSRKEALTDEMLLDSARYGIVEGLHAGITTYADTCAAGLVMDAMLAMGVLPLATAYSLSEALGFEKGLSRSFREAPIFLGTFTFLVAVGAAIAVIPNLPLIRVLLVTQVINGLLLPFVLFAVLRLVNDRELMGSHVNGPLYNVLAWATAIIVTILSLAFILISVIKE